MATLTLFAIPIVGFTLWLCMVQFSRLSFATLRQKRICLLIAHPDDEAMFFSPTVIALTDSALGNHVQILCLCSGEAPALRETRKIELLKSADILGLRSPKDVCVLDDERFPDSMSITWDPVHVASVLSARLLKADSSAELESTANSSAPTAASIDVLITFDHRGISSHANHISLYHGALHWLKKERVAGDSIVLYSLTTTNVVRKYVSLFDGPISILSSMLQSQARIVKAVYPARLLYVSGIRSYRKAQMAMTQGHKSQMLWFRYGWIGLSRYVSINDLKRQWPKSG